MNKKQPSLADLGLDEPVISSPRKISIEELQRESERESALPQVVSTRHVAQAKRTSSWLIVGIVLAILVIAIPTAAITYFIMNFELPVDVSKSASVRDFDLHGISIGSPISLDVARKYGISIAPPDNTGATTGYEKLDLDGNEVAITYELIDNKVEAVYFSFDSSCFDTLKKLFEKKYGHPTVETAELQNGFGAKFQNVTLKWATKSGEFECRRYTDKLDKGAAMIISEKSLDLFKKSESAKDRELLKKL